MLLMFKSKRFCCTYDAFSLLAAKKNHNSTPETVAQHKYPSLTLKIRLDGAMNQQMKLTIRPKIESYVKRAEEIKDILKNGAPKKKAVADSANGRGNGKDKGGDDDDGDPDKKRMMQKFEGSSESPWRCPWRTFPRRLVSGAIVTDPNVTFADVVGLEQAKEALKEAVILPVKFPQLFQGEHLFSSSSSSICSFE